MIAQQHQAVRIEVVQAAVAGALVADQASILQDAQVHRHGRPTDWQAAGEIADGARAVGQSLDDAAAGGVAQRRQTTLSCVSVH